MRLFDLATWTSVVILIVGATLVFLWFLKDAGKVLRGSDVGDSDGEGDGAGDTPLDV